MLKYIVLAGAMTISVPVFAQDKPADSVTAPTTQVAPAQTVPAPATPADPAQPQTVTPADPMATSAAAQDSAAPAQQAPAPAQQAVAQPAQPAQVVTGAAQIAQVVNNEFPTYDTDKNGTLDKTEFAAWMIALKEKSDPSTKPDSPATKAWIDKAFASADKDKNKAVTKSELTGFLSQGA
jgi:hypothetical protein